MLKNFPRIEALGPKAKRMKNALPYANGFFKKLNKIVHREQSF